jgi:hypothetical protein
VAEADACRTCGAPILWARTRKGNAAPMDAAPHEDGRFRLVKDEGGQLEAVSIPREELDFVPARKRYRSHFSSCPQSRGWRGRHR